MCHLPPQPVSASTLSPAQEDILAEAAAHGGRLLVTREAEADSRYASNGGGGAAALARQVVEAYEPVAGPEAVQTPKQVCWRVGCGGVVQVGKPVAGPEAVQTPKQWLHLLPVLTVCCPPAGRWPSMQNELLHQAPRSACKVRTAASGTSCHLPLRQPTQPQVYEALQAEGYRVTYVRIPLTDGACPLPRDFDTFYSAAAAAGPSDALIYTCQVGRRGGCLACLGLDAC